MRVMGALMGGEGTDCKRSLLWQTGLFKTHTSTPHLTRPNSSYHDTPTQTFVASVWCAAGHPFGLNKHTHMQTKTLVSLGCGIKKPVSQDASPATSKPMMARALNSA